MFKTAVQGRGKFVLVVFISLPVVSCDFYLKMIFRIRFYDDTKKIFATDWILCKTSNSVTLLMLYDKIYSGEIEFDLKTGL